MYTGYFPTSSELISFLTCAHAIYTAELIYMSWPVVREFWWHPLVGLAEMGGLGRPTRGSPLTPVLIISSLDHLTDWPPYVCNKDRPTQSVSSQSFYPCFVLSVLSVRSIASWKQRKLARATDWKPVLLNLHTPRPPSRTGAVAVVLINMIANWLPIDCPTIANWLPGSQALPPKSAHFCLSQCSRILETDDSCSCNGV